MIKKLSKSILILIFVSGCSTVDKSQISAWKDVRMAEIQAGIMRDQAQNAYKPELDFMPMKTSSKTVNHPELTDDSGIPESSVIKSSEVDSEALAVHMLGKVALLLARNHGAALRPVIRHQETKFPENSFVQNVNAISKGITDNGGWIGGVAKRLIEGKLITDLVQTPNRVGDDVYDSYNDESTTITKYAPPEGEE